MLRRWFGFANPLEGDSTGAASGPLGSFRAALSSITGTLALAARSRSGWPGEMDRTRDPRAYPVLVRTRRLLRLHSWAAFLLIGGPNTVERDTPANSLQRRRFKGEGRTRRSALVARNPGDWYPPDSTRVNNPFQERRHWAKHRRSPLLWCQLLGPGPQSSFRFRRGPHLLSFRFGSCRRVFHGFLCRICGWFRSCLRRRQRSFRPSPRTHTLGHPNPNRGPSRHRKPPRQRRERHRCSRDTRPHSHSPRNPDTRSRPHSRSRANHTRSRRSPRLLQNRSHSPGCADVLP